MRSDIEVPWWSSERFAFVATAVLFAWWNPNPNPTTNPDFNIGLIFFSLLFFITFRGLFFFYNFRKSAYLCSSFLHCWEGSFSSVQRSNFWI